MSSKMTLNVHKSTQETPSDKNSKSSAHHMTTRYRLKSTNEIGGLDSKAMIYDS